MKKLMVMVMALGFSAALTATAADAKENWDKLCKKCHGEDGKGQTTMGKKMGIKDYSDAKVQGELKDDAAIKAIKDGMKDKEGKVLMKPTEGLTDDEIKALVQHLRGFKK